MSRTEKVDYSIEEKADIVPPTRKSHGRRKTVYISALLAALGGVSGTNQTGAIGIANMHTHCLVKQ